MRGGMNSHDVDEKRPKIVYLAYINTAHTTNCMDIYNLQHIVLHAACLLAASLAENVSYYTLWRYYVIVS